MTRSLFVPCSGTMAIMLTLVALSGFGIYISTLILPYPARIEGGRVGIPKVNRYVLVLVTSPLEVLNIANFALGEINGLQGSQNSMEQIISAKTQVAAGVNYVLAIRIKEGDKTQMCEVRIWYQSWTNTKKVTEHKCSAVSKRGLFLGGVEPANLTAPVQQAVSFAEDALNGKMNNMFRMVTEKVDHVTRQVVAGTKYSFDLHLVTSSCMNNGDSTGKGITDCPASNSMPQHMTCKVSVWYQAWSDPKYQVVSDSCGQLA